jgi:predicted dehydrogenase
MRSRMNRRNFLKTGAAAAAGAAWLAGPPAVFSEDKKTTNKLKIGIIGTHGMGGGNHSGMLSEEIVAICDVDSEHLDKGSAKSPKARRFTDFRKMFDEVKDLEAVVVSTPDHTHAVAAVQAMKLGLHCYCEKPLTHDVSEARVMREVAASTKAKGGGKIITQMGNRGTADNGFRKGVEFLQAGVLGPVREVHVWTNRPIWPQGGDKRPEAKPAPPKLAWDLWLGTAPERPYGDGYHPFNWRGWWDFGTGALGDMACHTANLPFMGLKLGSPRSVEAKTSGINPEMAPNWCTIVYEFPARGELPPVKLTWYDGTLDGKRNGPRNRPSNELVHGDKLSDSGLIVIGEKGTLYSPNDYGAVQKLYPADKAATLQAPTPTLRRVDGNHYREWIDACKGGPPTLSNFDYAGPLTEFVLLGNVAARAGKKIEWDAEKLTTGSAAGDQYLKRQYRQGWSL